MHVIPTPQLLHCTGNAHKFDGLLHMVNVSMSLVEPISSLAKLTVLHMGVVQQSYSF